MCDPLENEVDALESELQEAVLVAFAYGAVNWCILNYYNIIKSYIKDERWVSGYLYINGKQLDDDVKEFYLARKLK